MPILSLVDPKEFENNKKVGSRKTVEAEYDALLWDYQPLEYVSVNLSDGDNRLTVKNRLESAAKRRNCWCQWIRKRQPDTLYFQLRPQEVEREDLDVSDSE